MALLTQLTSQEKCSNTRSRNSVVLFNVCLLALPHRHVHLCMVHIPLRALDFIRNGSDGECYLPPVFWIVHPMLTYISSFSYLSGVSSSFTYLSSCRWLIGHCSSFAFSGQCRNLSMYSYARLASSRLRGSKCQSKYHGISVSTLHRPNVQHSNF